MSRKRYSIRNLAAEASMTAEEVLTALGAQGVAARSERSGISPKAYRHFLASIRAGEAVARAEPNPLATSMGQDALDPPESTGSEDKWPIIGTPSSTHPISADEVNEIHWTLVNFFRDKEDPLDPPGIRDTTLFYSAIERPHVGFGAERKYPTVSMQAAALLHALVNNHPFHNGNKRTALVSVLAFLRRNGVMLNTDLTQDEITDFFIAVASHDIDIEFSTFSQADSEVLGIARWIQRNSRQIEKGERTLKFSQLKKLLIYHGCQVTYTKKAFVNIERMGRKVQIAYGGEGRDCSRQTIHKIRKALRLDEEHGCDSDTFYNSGEQTQDFIQQYQAALARLAKL